MISLCTCGRRRMETMTVKQELFSVQPEQGPSLSLLDLGSGLYWSEVRTRFQGIRANILQEMRSGMCTPDQAYTYLEHFEQRLLQEQEDQLQPSHKRI